LLCSLFVSMDALSSTRGGLLFSGLWATLGRTSGVCILQEPVSILFHWKKLATNIPVGSSTNSYENVKSCSYISLNQYSEIYIYLLESKKHTDQSVPWFYFRAFSTRRRKLLNKTLIRMLLIVKTLTRVILINLKELH
jgi:hypothetical protein